MRSHPREKLGRNDPCPCGSGRKYKRCCFRSGQVVEQIENTPWQLQHDASQRLTRELLRFVKSNFADDLQEAWEDFNQEDFPRRLEKFPAEEQIFMPYFLFDWDPERPLRRRTKPRRPGIVARAFPEERAKHLGNLELVILHLSIAAPLSFYEVLRCEPGLGMSLRDVLIGGEVEVEEHSGSRTMRAGDILYGQLHRLPDVTALGRLAPTALRPSRKAELVRLRAWMRGKIGKQNRELDQEDLIRFEEKIRTEYLNARDAAYAPPLLRNTDGEMLLLHTLRFRVGSAQVAFDTLAPLAWGQTKEELNGAADVDADGVLRRAEFDWRKPGNAMHKSWDNTILGHLKIEDRKLTVDVNSANRAKKIREEIEKRLGMMAVHQSTTTVSQKEMMKRARSRDTPAEESAPPHGENVGPQAQEALKAMLAAEAEAWVDQKIPILGGRTPREAVADPDGREIVEGLLQEWERRNEDSGDPAMQSMDVDAIRRRLGL
jgi:hypothetical protein